MAGVVKTLNTKGGLVTAASGGTVDTADITISAVTYARIQDISAASRLLGRGSASGSGVTQEITIGTGLSMSGTTLSASGTGTVTSVDITGPSSFLSWSGNPVTTSGTLTATLSNQSANQVLSGPASGGATTPGFRALVAADIPFTDTNLILAGMVFGS